MKIGCKCGAVIPDQTDFLSFKAHLIADRDWDDFADASEPHSTIDSSLVRICYQCPQCGRLYVEDASRNLYSFAPEGHKTQVLSSIKGLAWRGPLIGAWSDKPSAGQSKGTLWCDAEEGTSEQFNEWSQLENAYHVLFERLRKLDRLRSAILRKDGKDVHIWAPDA